MKRFTVTGLLACGIVITIGATLQQVYSLPARFGPKVTTALVYRRADNIHSGYWSYTLRLTGNNFNADCKVEVDGEISKGKYFFDYAGRDVYSIRVVLGSWSRAHIKPKKRQVVVIAPVKTRGGIEQMRSEPVDVIW